jgi:hypothetical protein
MLFYNQLLIMLQNPMMLPSFSPYTHPVTAQAIKVKGKANEPVIGSEKINSKYILVTSEEE